MSAPPEDIVAKYKRLLSLARSSLEANQLTISSKDEQIQQLLAAIDEERLHNNRSSNSENWSKADLDELVPRRILCRVDVEQVIWILIEYEEIDDVWKSFNTETALEEFIQRIPGVPIVCPRRRISEEESAGIEETSRSKLDKAVEEFRRYKVRTEIAIKQRDAEIKKATITGTTTSSSSYPYSESSSSSSNSSSSSSSSSSGQQFNDDNTKQDDVSRLTQQLAETEAKWRAICDKIQQENNILSKAGGESILATKWRARYENALQNKEEISNKLKVYTKLSDDLNAAGMTIEQAYVELQAEFKDFRMKVLAVEQSRQKRASAALASASASASATSTPLGKGSSSYSSRSRAGSSSITSPRTTTNNTNNKNNNSSSSSSSSSNNNNSTDSTVDSMPSVDFFNKEDLNSVLKSQNLDFLQLHETSVGYINSPIFSKHPSMTQPHRNAGFAPVGSIECKIQYVRHMVLKYLTCRDAEVKLGIEAALVAIFRLNEKERHDIQRARKDEEEALDTIGQITAFLGEAFTLSTA